MKLVFHRKGQGHRQNKEKEKDKSDATTNQLLQTIVLQNQAKNETFQNALLAMMNTSMTMLQVRFGVVMTKLIKIVNLSLFHVFDTCSYLIY